VLLQSAEACIDTCRCQGTWQQYSWLKQHCKGSLFASTYESAAATAFSLLMYLQLYSCLCRLVAIRGFLCLILQHLSDAPQSIAPLSGSISEASCSQVRMSIRVQLCKHCAGWVDCDRHLATLQPVRVHVPSWISTCCIIC
jgi:hypothetical protein